MATPCKHIASPLLPGRTADIRRLHVPFTAHSPCRRRVLQPTRAIDRDGQDDPKGGDGGLSSVFNNFVLVKGIASPAAATRQTNPSPLVPPTSVIEQAMTVLQRNDWPDADTGVLTAFHLTAPAPEDPSSVRSWRAEEEWLSWPRFHAQLHVGYTTLLHCDSWRVVSPLVFPSTRHDNRAVQAVEVWAAPRRPRPQPQAQASPGSLAGQGVGAEGTQGGGDDGGDGDGGDATAALRSYTYTFCLERQDAGPYKDCWLIAGVRTGNYAV